MSVPRVRTIFFATGQTFPIKRFGFSKPLLAAQRAGQRAQGNFDILATTIALAAYRQGLAKAGFGLSQVALVEETVAATEKLTVVGRIPSGLPAKDLEGLPAGIVGLGQLAFERQHPRKRVE